ncbi:putative inorganic phosphate cotransporter [Parasteatoda tepidariorum]|uniref:putative inorganic phosphate cotransporter n=1 Tax=Parasteatoda tepidariorum TaxID=114398 RepID=UPI0039BC3CB1
MDHKKEEINETAHCKKFYFPKRYTFVFLSLLGTFCVFTMRASVSISIVAMVNHTDALSINSSSESLNECSNLQQTSKGIEHEYKGEHYNWDIKTQADILGCYFYGNVATQVLGGILAEKFGFKFIYGGGILMTAIVTLLIPVVSSWGYTAVIIIRIIQGLGDGLTFPAINVAISKWSPTYERSRFSAIIFSGIQIGTVIGMPISGILCTSDLLGGWPSVYYIFGSITCLWSVFWWLLIYEEPSMHPTISREELFHIEKNKNEAKMKMSRDLWKNMLTSIPLWAVMIAHFGCDYGFWTMLTELPTYLSTALHYDLKSNGLLSTLPFLSTTAGAWVSSYIADYLRKSNKLSITFIRKLMNSLGTFIPAIAMVGVTFCGCHPGLIITLLCIAMAFAGFALSGFNVTHVDMCPDFAGTSYAITNSVGNTAGIFGPMSVGIFTSSGPTLANWSKVFYTSAAIYAISGILFAAFGSAELQNWGSTKNCLKKPEINPPKELNAGNLKANV